MVQKTPWGVPTPHWDGIAPLQPLSALWPHPRESWRLSLDDRGGWGRHSTRDGTEESPGLEAGSQLSDIANDLCDPGYIPPHSGPQFPTHTIRKVNQVTPKVLSSLMFRNCLAPWPCYPHLPRDNSFHHRPEKLVPLVDERFRAPRHQIALI